MPSGAKHLRRPTARGSPIKLRKAERNRSRLGGSLGKPTNIINFCTPGCGFNMVSGIGDTRDVIINSAQ
jgi:hypothetical protein